MRATIKVKAYAVLLDSSRTRHAVWVGEDSTKDPSSFHRLLGGHVEFGEPATEAVVREIAEELGTQVTAMRSLGVLESFFVHEGEPGHEVAFIYGGTISESAVPPDGGWFYDGGPIRVEWRPVAGEAAVPLYPEGAQDLIDEWISELSRREVPKPLEGFSGATPYEIAQRYDAGDIDREQLVEDDVIEKVAWVLLRDGQILVTRNHGRNLFYLPGGRREPGETDRQTLIREIDEELQTAIDAATMAHVGTFEVPPGHPEHGPFRMICYTADHRGELIPSSEIAEKAWFGFADRARVSVVDGMVFDALHASGRLR